LQKRKEKLTEKCPLKKNNDKILSESSTAVRRKRGSLLNKSDLIIGQHALQSRDSIL
jgi:hypothetical protein